MAADRDLFWQEGMEHHNLAHLRIIIFLRKSTFFSRLSRTKVHIPTFLYYSHHSSLIHQVLLKSYPYSACGFSHNIGQVPISIYYLHYICALTRNMQHIPKSTLNLSIWGKLCSPFLQYIWQLLKQLLK